MPAVNRGRCFRSMAESLFIIKFPADKEKLSASNFSESFLYACCSLKNEMVSFNPSSRETAGVQPRHSCARDGERQERKISPARAGPYCIGTFFRTEQSFFRQCSQRHFRAGADVADGAAAPCERGQIGGDDIVDVDKITGLFACAEDRERFSLRKQPGKDIDDAAFSFRTLPGAVYIAVAEDRIVQAVKTAVESQVFSVIHFVRP